MLSLTFLALFSFSVALEAGSTPAAEDAPGREALKQSASEFWRARVDGDWEKVYPFWTPNGFAPRSLEEFVETKRTEGPMVFHSAEVLDVRIDGEFGWVKVKHVASLMKIPDLPPRETEVWNQWQKGGESWYPVAQAVAKLFPDLPPHLRPVDEEAQLREQVSLWWRSLAKGEPEKAYPLLDPTMRERASLEEFVQEAAKKSVDSFVIDWVEVKDDRGTARLSTTLLSPSGGRQERFIIEEWIKEEGRWFRTGS